MADIFYYNDNTTKDHHDGSLNVVKVEWDNGCVEIYDNNGQLHNEELDEFGNLKPALIHTDGSKEYWTHGQRRPVNEGPAIEWADGSLEWADGTIDYYQP